MGGASPTYISVSVILSVGIGHINDHLLNMLPVTAKTTFHCRPFSSGVVTQN